MLFEVYAKEADTQPIEVELPQGFKIDGTLLRPSYGAEASVWGVLNLKNIAAVVKKLTDADRASLSHTFEVYLKGRKESVTVDAQAVRFSENTIEFCVIDTNLGSGGSMITRRPVPNLYIDMSEVVAVVPKNGFTGFATPSVPFED